MRKWSSEHKYMCF